MLSDSAALEAALGCRPPPFWIISVTVVLSLTDIMLVFLSLVFTILCSTFGFARFCMYAAHPVFTRLWIDLSWFLSSRLQCWPMCITCNILNQFVGQIFSRHFYICGDYVESPFRLLSSDSYCSSCYCFCIQEDVISKAEVVDILRR